MIKYYTPSELVIKARTQDYTLCEWDWYALWQYIDYKSKAIKLRVPKKKRIEVYFKKVT